MIVILVRGLEVHGQPAHSLLGRWKAGGSFLMEGIHLRARGVAVARRARGVGGLVDVFAVDVDSVGPEGRATVTAAGVALLEPEELDLGLEPVEERSTHDVGSGGWKKKRSRQRAEGKA